MLAIHIEETPEEIIVSRCDCVLARYDKYALSAEHEVVGFLEELLDALEYKVERD